MAKTKNGADAPTETVEPTTTRRLDLMEPWDRWGLGEAWWPSWFNRGWPDRLLGDVGNLFDHLKIEEFVDDDTLVVRAEIPGVDPDKDIDISVDKNRLVIKAERSSSFEDDSDGYRSEFRYGSFSRVVSLPEGVDVDDIDAGYTDGILEVRIPVGDGEKRPAKKIKVGRS